MNDLSFIETPSQQQTEQTVSDADAAYAAQAQYDENAQQDLNKYLTFWIDKQLYGMPISAVVQIVGVHKIVSLPEYPDYVKGIINLRGSIIPIIDIRLRFHKEECEYNERTCIIVTNIANKHVGFVVDSVDEVSDIQTENIVDTPTLANECGSTFLTGVGKLNGKIVLLLDVSKMIDSDKVLNM